MTLQQEWDELPDDHIMKKLAKDSGVLPAGVTTHDHAASAPAANEPTPGANDALAGIRALLKIGYAATLTVEQCAILDAALDAANERVAALEAQVHDLKQDKRLEKQVRENVQDYIRKNRDALDTDATAPTLEARLASGNRAIAPDELNEAITLIVAGKVRPIEGVDYARMPTAPTRETPILGNVHHFVEDDDFDSPSPHDDPCGPTPCGESDPPAPVALAAATKLPRLTKAQREALEIVKAAEDYCSTIHMTGGAHTSNRNYHRESYAGPQHFDIYVQTARALTKRGLLRQSEKFDFEYFLTDLGRRALADATPDGGER